MVLCFSTEKEQKRTESLGENDSRRGSRGLREENGTEQAFTDLTAHTLGSVTSNCRLFVGNYIIPNEKVNYC